MAPPTSSPWPRRLIVALAAIAVLMRATGTTNLDSLARPPEVPRSGSPMELAMREIRIERGHVLVDALGAKRRVAFDLDARTSLGLERGGAYVTTAGESEIGH